MKLNGLRLESTMHFCHVTELHAGAPGFDTLTGHVVKTEHNVLRRHDNGLAVRR